MKEAKLTYIWHVYHNRLITVVSYSSPIKKRRETIELNKPSHEHALRFRLLKRVKGKIPAGINSLVRRYYLVGERYDLADSKAILALHKRECKNCPWDGKSIFPPEYVPY